ncbi:MAG: cell wall hydrolase [Roseburia sp.]|nr:cell wall hydrolase [Roseburia sp.]
MNLKKRAVESILVAGTLVVMGGAAAEAGSMVVVGAMTVPTETDMDLAANGTAGVVVDLDQMKAEALENVEAITASVQQSDVSRVAAAEDEIAQEPVLSEEELAWQNRLLPDVQEFLYVRAEGDENAAIVGKLYKGAVAEIVEQGDDWCHITSGTVDGYVSNAYCFFGTDAMSYAEDTFDTKAEILTNGLRIRSEASLDASVISSVSSGTSLTVDTDVEAPEGWVAVKYAGTTGYVSAEYVSTELQLGVGITLEEEQAILAKKAEEEAARKAAQVAPSETVQNEAVAVSVDDVTLLAALIQCEAGNECYEGQLAVGAVVMNRVRSGRYPGSVEAVIYQSGQFPPAGKGKVADVIARGPKASCIQAAQEAINGMDNTGGATGFCRASSGRAGVVIGNHVFY